MNKKELELLEIAKKIIELNKNNVPMALSGSLMLKLRDIETRRPAHDIDIIVEEPLCEQEEESGYPILPKDFKMSEIDGSRSQVESMQFTQKNSGLKIDFISSDERFEEISGIACGTVYNLICAKIFYMLNDKSHESSEKHRLDLEFLKNKIDINIDEMIEKQKLSVMIFPSL